MANLSTNIKERVLLIAKNKGISYEAFFEDLGMTYGNFKGKAKNTPLNSDALANILSKYRDIHPQWLLTGEGSMIRNDLYRDEHLINHFNDPIQINENLPDYFKVNFDLGNKNDIKILYDSYMAVLSSYRVLRNDIEHKNKEIELLRSKIDDKDLLISVLIKDKNINSTAD